jgi:hypothetical protein
LEVQKFGSSVITIEVQKFFGSPEVQKSGHYYNETLVSDAYAFDWTSGLLDFRTS